MKILYKKPGEPAIEMDVPRDDLDAFHRLLGGYLEMVPLHALIGFDASDHTGWTLYCNEDGKHENLPGHIVLQGDLLVGPVIVCGSLDDEGDHLDVTREQMDQAIDYLDKFEVYNPAVCR